MKRLFVVAAVAASISAASAQDAPKTLSANDLSVETHKWEGRRIQATAHCFYADKDQYRCIVGAPGAASVRVDFAKVDPPAMKQALEDDCDTTERILTAPCTFRIVFTYQERRQQEQDDGSQLIFIMAADDAGVFSRGR